MIRKCVFVSEKGCQFVIGLDTLLMRICLVPLANCFVGLCNGVWYCASPINCRLSLPRVTHSSNRRIECLQHLSQ